MTRSHHIFRRFVYQFFPSRCFVIIFKSVIMGTFENSIKPLYYFHTIFGLWCISFNHYYDLEIINVILVFVIQLICSMRAEYILFMQNHIYFCAQHLVFFIGYHIYCIFTPMTMLIRYRLINNHLRLLMETVNRLCTINLHLNSAEYRKITRYATVTHILYFIYMILVWRDSIDYLKFSYFGTTCSILTEIWIFQPALQFFCWTLLFKFLFKKSENQLLTTIEHAKNTPDSFAQIQILSSRSRMKIRHSLKTVRLLITFKMMIIKIYDLQMVMFLLHLSNALMFQLNELLTPNKPDSFRPFLLLHLAGTTLFTILLFWISESSFICVSYINLLPSINRINIYGNFFEAVK